MQAICGLWRTDGQPAAESLERMLAALRPYGPDASGRWVEKEVGLGGRAMHLFPGDLPGGRPIIGGAGRYVLVADVRLDDRGELAAALGHSPTSARAVSDDEWVLRAFERWGDDCLGRLYGDYAIAVWDRARRRWLLARDGMGGRPLCYFRDHRLFAFASMPRGLHALPHVPYEANSDLLARGLDMLPQDPHAVCFRHIERVGMGEQVVITAEHATSRLHWNPDPEPLRLRSPHEYEEALRAEMDRAVRARLPESGDVATQLSAGIDSGSVTATAARLMAAEGRNVVAFTAVPRSNDAAIGPPHRLLDEGSFAAKTAALYPNIEHVRVKAKESPLDALSWVFELCEQPTLNLCNQAWRSAINDRVQSRGIAVLLNGQAGNFTLSYRVSSPFRQRLRARGLAVALDEARALSWAPGGFRQGLFQALTRFSGTAAPPSLHSFINPERRFELEAAAAARSNGHLADSRSDRVASIQRIDKSFYDKGTLARWRIEERDPTADRRLVEFCLSVPDVQYRLGGIPGSLGRRAMADRLPKEVIQLRTRGFQAADWQAGFTDPKRELGEEVAGLAACEASARLLDIPALRDAIEHWPSDNWGEPGVLDLYRLSLLRALSIGDFARRAAALRGPIGPTASGNPQP